jgi:hypothetical protein
LSLKELRIYQNMSPVNKLDLENPTVLIRLEQADMTKGKNVVNGDLRPEKDAESTPSRKVVMEKLPDGEETITITIKGTMMGHHGRKAKGSTLVRDDEKWQPTATDQEQVVRPPPGRLDHHGRPEQPTHHHGQIAHRAGQTVQLQDRPPQMNEGRLESGR